MQAAIFDFNGTLFDDTQYHLISWQRYLKKRFSMEMTLQQIIQSCIGPSNIIIFHNLFGNRYSDEELNEFSREKEAEYRSVARSDQENFHLMDGAAELFDLLQEKNIPFALATASVLDNVEFYLEELGLKRWFSMENIVYDQGMLKSKPAPDFYLEAAKRLNVPVDQCIVAEDSLIGIEAAVNAHAGRIIAIDRTVGREALSANPHIYAVIHDFRNCERYFIEK